jgi:ComF family protein
VSETICPICEKSAIAGATHPRCQTRYAIDRLTSFFHYDGIIRKAIKAIKYRYAFDLAKEFIDIIPLRVFNKRTIQHINNPRFVPIPLHSSRQRDRGFNQAELLGSLLAERLGIPIHTDMLERVLKTVPQVEVKDREKRLKNMKGVFGFKQSTVNIHQSTILLFDDVFTTGATLRSATSVLKRKGARFVWGVTMAR